MHAEAQSFCIWTSGSLDKCHNPSRPARSEEELSDLQWREHVRLTNTTLKDVTASEHQSVRPNLCFLYFYWRQNTYNEIFSGRQMSPGVKSSDVSENKSLPLFRVIPLNMGAESVSETSCFKFWRGCLSEKISLSHKTRFLRRKVTDSLRITWI